MFSKVRMHLNESHQVLTVLVIQSVTVNPVKLLPSTSRSRQGSRWNLEQEALDLLVLTCELHLRLLLDYRYKHDTGSKTSRSKSKKVIGGTSNILISIFKKHEYMYTIYGWRGSSSQQHHFYLPHYYGPVYLSFCLCVCLSVSPNWHKGGLTCSRSQ